MNTKIKTLTIQEMLEIAPAIFSKEPSSNRSDKYSFVNTHDVIKHFQNEGWHPHIVRQQKGNDNYHKKHLVRLYNEKHKNEELLPEIVIINSHNGTSCFTLELGVFRVVCENGMIIADNRIAKVKRRHNNITDEVLSIVYDASKEFDELWKNIKHYKSVKLNEKQKIDFASKVIEINELKYGPEMLLKIKREEDKKDDLFTVMNVIQENLTQGGIHYINNGKSITTKKIKSIYKDIKINKDLWKLMSNY